MMTPAQQDAIGAALKSAKHTIQVLEEMNVLSTKNAPNSVQAVIVAIATGQIACAREVCQYSANERAEIARLDVETIVKAIVDLSIP